MLLYMKVKSTFIGKLFLTLVLSLFSEWIIADEVDITIGNGSSTSYYIPYGNGYCFSTTECIYTSDEIGGGGSISKIAYYVSTASSHTANYEIYMGHKSASSFSSTSDYLKDYTLVYSGSLTLGTKTGWETITLSNPFTYNGKDNLVIAICKKSSSNNYSLNYRCSSTSSTQQLIRGTTYSSYSAYGDISSSSYSFSSYSYKPDIRISISGTNFINEEGLCFILYDDMTATLVDGKAAVGEVEIPDYVVGEDGNEYEVTSISANAFQNNTSLEYVYIPSTVTNIGANAFQGCTALTDIDLYSKATIGENAFDGCTAVSMVATKDAKTWLGNTFANAKSNPLYYSKAIKVGKNLTDIVVPASIKDVSAYAFYNAQNLTSVTFEDGATNIGSYAFYGCTNLGAVTLPGTLETLGSYAFSGDANLTQVTVKDGEGSLTFGTQVFSGVKIEDLYMGKSWTTTATANSSDAPFYKKTSIMSLEIGGRTTSIPQYAFNGCTGIKDIHIPGSMTNIGTYAFYNCTGAQTVTFDEGAEDLTIAAYAFYGSNKVTSLNLPGNLTSLSYYNFVNFTELTSVRFADGTKSCELISSGSDFYAFNNCSKITDVYIGKNFTWSSINYDRLMFYNKTSIKNVTYGNLVTSAANNMFYNCSGITSLTLGDKLQRIGSNTFCGCSNISEVVFPSTLREINNYAFSGCSKLQNIIIPQGDSDLTIGEYSFQSCAFASLTLPSNVTSIGNCAFNGIYALKEITLEGDESNRTLTVGKYIFQNTSIETVNLDRNIVYGSGVSPSNATSYSLMLPFNYCSTIKTVNIGDHVTAIPSYLFCYNTNMTSLHMGENVQSVATYAFYSDSKLTSLSLPGTLTTLGTYAFYNCTGVKEITIGDNDGTLTFGDYSFNSVNPNNVYVGKSFTCNTNSSAPFYGRTSIVNLTLGSQVRDIPTYAFYGCTSISKLNIPASVHNIGDYAFSGCTNIANLTIEDGDNTLAIGSYVFEGNKTAKLYLGRTYSFSGTNANGPFYGKTTIDSVTISDKVKNIPTYAFYGCSAIPSIELPNSVTSLGTYSFYGCSSASTLTLSESLTAIPSNCFNGCSSLTELVLPEKIKSIGTSAFANCENLVSVTSYNPETYRISNTVFSAVDYDVCVLYVPEGTSQEYADQDYWSNFSHIVELLPPHFVVVDANGVEQNVFARNDGTVVVLQDGIQKLTVEEPLSIDKFSYKRNFNNTNWQALYVPFSMNYEDWCDEFDVARINNMNQYDDDDNGSVDRTVMEVFKVTSGSLESNTPYLIKAKSTGNKTISLNNITLAGTEENTFDVSSWSTLYTFSGVYGQVSGSDMVSNGYYALGSGMLRQAASSANSLPALRWYMNVTSRYGAPKPVREIRIQVWDEDKVIETGILSVDEEETDNAAVYDLSGRRVSGDNRGIYIVNGRKFVRK